MLVHDLQTFLSKFTEGAKIKKMEVHESNIIGQPGHRLVLKTQQEKKFTIADSLKMGS
jgi:hypothetical protein